MASLFCPRRQFSSWAALQNVWGFRRLCRCPGPTPRDWDSCDAWWVPGIGLYGDIISFNSCSVVSCTYAPALFPLTDISVAPKISNYSTFYIHLFLRSCLSRNTVNDFEMGGEKIPGCLVWLTHLSYFLPFIVFELFYNSVVES